MDTWYDLSFFSFPVDANESNSSSHQLGATLGATVAGSTSDPGPYAYQLYNPTAISFDPYGYMYILDYSNARVQRWLPGASYGVTVVSAAMSAPVGMRIDRLGNIVIADTSYHRVISCALTCRK